MMKPRWLSRCKRALPALAGLLTLAALLLTLAGPTAADTPASVVRVEEDWSLLVNQPNADLAAPQISTQMARSPYTSRFANLHLNSIDLPNFQLGGLQLQAWKGSTNLSVLTLPQTAVMSTPNELVTWTQYLRLDSSNNLYFGVSASSSTTWGDFSGKEIQVPGSNTDLSNYSSDYSVQNSGVTFGANRVQSLVLVQNRVYYSDGSVVTDSTPHPVYSVALDADLGGD